MEGPRVPWALLAAPPSKPQSGEGDSGGGGGGDGGGGETRREPKLSRNGSQSKQRKDFGLRLTLGVTLSRVILRSGRAVASQREKCEKRIVPDVRRILTPFHETCASRRMLCQSKDGCQMAGCRACAPSDRLLYLTNEN